MSVAPMSLAKTLSAAILDTILSRLALLFLSATAGDLAAARHAAAQMLAAYHPGDENELRLAAEIVSFSLHALQALAQACEPDMPMNRILRLRGSAVSLSREAHKSERRLGQLQKSRRDSVPSAIEAVAPTPDPPAPQPKVERALDLIDETATVSAVAKATGVTWSKAYQQRQRAKRITENMKKNQTAQTARLNVSPVGAVGI